MHNPFTTTCPTEHKEQFEIEIDPTAEDDPSGHETHELAAETPEYFPPRQLVHTLALVALVAFEYAPDGQLRHDEFPETFLNFPATQVVQTPPSGPVYPMIHLQCEIDFDVFENGDCEFAGHDTQLIDAFLIITSDMYDT